MYTFAEVSILEFDPTLRMECKRMAVRESNTAEKQKRERYAYTAECECEWAGAGT
jgi:ATPase family AAA domain-containing protein 2